MRRGCWIHAADARRAASPSRPRPRRASHRPTTRNRSRSPTRLQASAERRCRRARRARSSRGATMSAAVVARRARELARCTRARRGRAPALGVDQAQHPRRRRSRPGRCGRLAQLRASASRRARAGERERGDDGGGDGRGGRSARDVDRRSRRLRFDGSVAQRGGAEERQRQARRGPARPAAITRIRFNRSHLPTRSSRVAWSVSSTRPMLRPPASPRRWRDEGLPTWSRLENHMIADRSATAELIRELKLRLRISR